MNLVKNFGRKLIFPAILSTGAENIFSSFTNAQCLILNYHGVVKNLNKQLSKNHLSIDQFNLHLNYFSKHYNVISLDEAFEIYQSRKKTIKKSIAITFDDGYLNNLTHALPALKKYSFPATIFVTAQSVLNPEIGLWYDQLDMLSTKISFAKISETLKSVYPLALNLHSFSDLKAHFKTLNKDEKKLLLDFINSNDDFRSAIISCDEEYWKLLNASQLSEIASENNIEIGSHGFSHSNLDRLNAEMLRYELKESKSILEKTINKKIHSIAFPDGAYNETVKKISAEEGYDQLLAVTYKLEDDREDKRILPRLSISNTTTYESVMIAVHRAFASLGF